MFAATRPYYLDKEMLFCYCFITPLKKFIGRGGTMKRRRFLQIFLTFLGSITLFSFACSLLKYLTALPSRFIAADKMLIRKNDVPSGNSKSIIYRNTPTIVVNRPDKGFIALSRVCTHLGCLLEYDRRKQRLICPCHAGSFDLDGAVISGPPPKPLTVIPLRIEGETIILG
jgi:cytochrome b6-f complex iron-sulfur subunit